MMPEDQAILRDVMRMDSLMNEFLAARSEHRSAWYQTNLSSFLLVCDLHGEAAKQHHDQLVSKYIAKPALQMVETHLDKITASGPPLPVLLAGLEKLRDRRAARQRDDIVTRYDDIQQLKASLGE